MSQVESSSAHRYTPDPDLDAAGDESFVAAHRVKLLLGAVIVAGALAYLAFIAFQSATVYYYTVGEAQQLGPTDDGRLIRVNGKLNPASFERQDGSATARFELTDGSETLVAVHEGVLPDLFFNEHSEIILEGAFDKQKVFRSENVIVKCPSKYVAMEEEAL